MLVCTPKGNSNEYDTCEVWHQRWQTKLYNGILSFVFSFFHNIKYRKWYKTVWKS